MRSIRTLSFFASAAVALACAAPVASNAKTPAAPMVSCLHVKAHSTHGGPIRPNSTVSPIRDGKVLTIDPVTNATSYSRFTARSGRWLTTERGSRYAVSGQWISPSGKRGGGLQVASPNRADRRVLCMARGRVRASAADTASSTADGSLWGGGYMEVAGSTTNVAGTPLVNHATRDVCLITSGPTTIPPAHPDGAALAGTNPHPTARSWCFSGAGAGLNDMYGAERYSPAQGGLYIDDPYHRHFIAYNGATVAAAKRPNFYPGTCNIIPGSKIAWRTVAPNCNVAN